MTLAEREDVATQSRTFWLYTKRCYCTVTLKKLININNLSLQYFKYSFNFSMELTLILVYVLLLVIDTQIRDKISSSWICWMLINTSSQHKRHSFHFTILCHWSPEWMGTVKIPLGNSARGKEMGFRSAKYAVSQFMHTNQKIAHLEKKSCMHSESQMFPVCLSILLLLICNTTLYTCLCCQGWMFSPLPEVWFKSL